MKTTKLPDPRKVKAPLKETVFQCTNCRHISFSKRSTKFISCGECGKHRFKILVKGTEE